MFRAFVYLSKRLLSTSLIQVFRILPRLWNEEIRDAWKKSSTFPFLSAQQLYLPGTLSIRYEATGDTLHRIRQKLHNFRFRHLESSKTSFESVVERTRFFQFFIVSCLQNVYLSEHFHNSTCELTCHVFGSLT